MLSMILALAAGVPAAASPASGADWPVYGNPRYGYEMCYDPRLFTPQTEAKAGDGRRFTGKYGAELLVFAQYDAAESGLAQWVEQQAAYYTGKNGHITHRVIHPGLAEVVGDDGHGRRFFNRTLKRPGPVETFLTVQLSYPAAESARFEPVVQKLAGCLKFVPQEEN